MERWNEINYILSERISRGISEADFERNVIEALRIMGWSEFRGEVSIHPSFNIGASNRITPDIIMKNGDENLFVIEIKQPEISLKPRFTEQLTSYLRFLKLEVGIIIGEKILLVYDDRSNGKDEVLVFDEIEYVADNPKGKAFVEAFSKKNYSPDNILVMVTEKRKALQEKEQAEQLKSILLSTEGADKIKEILTKSFSIDYPDNVVSKVINELEFSITDPSIRNEPVFEPSVKRTSKPEPVSVIPGQVKIGRYVRDTFRELISKLNLKDVENLQRQDFSKEVFDIQFPFLKKASSTGGEKPHRYWKEPVQILGEWYFMCSEWYEVPANNDRPYYEAWLRQMKKR